LPVGLTTGRSGQLRGDGAARGGRRVEASTYRL